MFPYHSIRSCGGPPENENRAPRQSISRAAHLQRESHDFVGKRGGRPHSCPTAVESRNTLQLCPNGAASSSPGLARAAGLPWVGALRDEQPQRGCGVGCAFLGSTPLGLDRSVARIPKVAAARQPWALGLSPVGAGS